MTEHPEILPLNQMNKLQRLFVIAPFSVFNTMAAQWRDRKTKWLSLGLRSDLGRGADIEDGRKLPPGGGGSKSMGRTYGQDLMKKENPNFGSKSDTVSGTSIFDPVLCEIMLRWFAGKHSRIFDPFAGGSVRGVVSGLLGHSYTGIDLRMEQVAADCQQWVDVLKKCAVLPLRVPDNIAEPHWYVGDAVEKLKTAKRDWADFILTCPPYTFLEQYSDDPKDLSTMNYVDFLKCYRYVIRRCVRMLRPDRFACFVVGEVRDPKNRGIYVNFVGDTITAFQDAGMGLYNHAILMTSAGSLPIRVGHQMNASAKLGARHQDVLIFIKGDPVAAHKAMPFNFESLPCLVLQTETDMGHEGFGYQAKGLDKER